MKLFKARYAQPLPGGTVTIREEAFYLSNENEVRRSLRARGMWPIKIFEQKPPALEWMDVRSRQWQTQLLRALRFQTATASVGTAFLNIIEAEEDSRKRLVFIPARTILKGGGSFSDALKSLRLFDAATMAIIIAGERAGDLKGVVPHAIQHVEDKGKQGKIIMAALSWLSFDILNVMSALWGAQFGFIPYLRKNTPEGAKPEDLERMATAIDRASLINGTLLTISLAAIAGAVFLSISFWMNKHKADHFAARVIMKTPLFGEYLKNSAMFDTMRLIARLLRGKVPLDEAMKIIIDTTIEPSVRIYWTECRRRIMMGVNPTKSLARWPLTRAERDQIMTATSIDQFIEVFEAISEERQSMAKASQRKIVLGGMVVMMGLFGAVVLTMIYLLMIQNSGFMDSIKGLKG